MAGERAHSLNKRDRLESVGPRKCTLRLSSSESVLNSKCHEIHMHKNKESVAASGSGTTKPVSANVMGKTGRPKLPMLNARSRPSNKENDLNVRAETYAFGFGMACRA